MTKQPPKDSFGPASDSEVGAPEITSAMLKAGIDVIAEEYAVCGADIAPDLARDVFTAMWAHQKDQEPS